MISVIITPLPSALPLHWRMPTISPERTALIARKRHPADRMRSQIADALLLNLAIPPRVHHYSERGQPLSPVPGTYLSASHDGQWIVAATATEPIGVDIVDINRVDPKSARQFQTSSEREHSRACVSSAQEKRFAAFCWAAKEAYSKREGVGLAIDPREIRVDALLADRAVVHHSHSSAPVQFAQIDRDHVLAVASVERTVLHLRFVALPRFATDCLPAQTCHFLSNSKRGNAHDHHGSVSRYI